MWGREGGTEGGRPHGALLLGQDGTPDTDIAGVSFSLVPCNSLYFIRIIPFGLHYGGL